MRLTCPNCGAQYELAEGVIPPEGRDVECSACAHVWFQRARSPLRTPAPVTPPAPAAPVPPPASIQFAPFEDEATPAPRLPDFAPIPDDEDDAPAAIPPRRPLNESLLAVLREEAERESAARRAEASRFEFQPDLGLAEPPRPAPPAAAPQPANPAVAVAPPRNAAPVAEPVAPAPEPLASPGPAPADPLPPPPPAPRPVLADPEAIGATLTSTRPADPPRLPEPQAAAAAPAEAEARRATGFWWGFLLALLIAGAAGGAYWRAPQLAAAWPAAAPILDAYAARVDALRARLADMVR